MKAYFFLVIFFVLGINNIFAQDECPIKKQRELQGYFNEISSILEYNQSEGIPKFESFIKQNPKYYPASLLLGSTYLKLSEKESDNYNTQRSKAFAELAVKYLNMSYQECDKYLNHKAHFLLGEAYFMAKDFDNASEVYSSFLNCGCTDNSRNQVAGNHLLVCQEYIRLKNNPVKFNPKELKEVSTIDDEYLPYLSPDGTILLFTRRSKKSNGEYVEELIKAKKLPQKDTSVELFDIGEKLPSPFNTGKLQGGACITIDNKVIYVTICDYSRTENTSVEDCDIYYSEYKNGMWSNLIKMPNTINSQNFEGQPSIDYTGNVLYFSSNRPGGYGGYDIYKVERKDKGELWSKPINLGPKINTEMDEKTPFIHGDGRTLYFASNGHNGMGGFDIFVSRLGDDDLFQKPENIGYPINTENDEVAYIISADGKRLYFSGKFFSGTGGWDIYSSDVPENAEPGQILLLTGTVTNKYGQGIPNVDVELTGLKTFNSVSTTTDSQTGEYSLAAPVLEKENFVLKMSKKGFFYETVLINPDSSIYIPPTMQNIIMDSVKVGVPVRLKNVNFASNSSALVGDAVTFIHLFFQFLTEYPNYKVEICGHTDNIGNPESNLALSRRRCNVVKNYLIKLGIDPKRLIVKAYGQTKPIVPNTSSENRALNRRVEFILLDK